jgi:6-phosphogluconolactonase
VQNLSEILALDFEAEGVRAIEERGVFTVALPGGSVAVSFFSRLNRVSVDWSRTEFFWVDERAVPITDPESNYALAASLWLDPATIPRERVHPMPIQGPDPMTSAEEYARDLRRLAGVPPRLDYVLLGVGADGHVASLFPDHPVLQENERLVAIVNDAPKPPPRRMTLTVPVLAAARRIVVAAFGRSKAQAISSAIDQPDSPLPLARVIRGQARVLFLLDEEAAAVSVG